MPETAAGRRSGFELDLKYGVPIVQFTFLALMVWVFLVGGTITFGTWGDVDARLMAGYLIPALALHAWSGWRPRLWPRVAAWALVFVMLVHTGTLVQPLVLATLGLLAALDLGLHASKVPRSRVSVAARAAAAGTGLIAFGLLVFLYQFATFDAMMRLGATTILGAALVIACALVPAMRAPQRLLPALGVYYLAFVLMAAPVLPFGPAIAWWFLCASVFLGAIVAARHVSGTELPEGQRKHEHVVSHLPDPFVAADANMVEEFLATGAHTQALSERIEAARGLEPTGKALREAVREVGGKRPGREHRTHALRHLLEMTP